MFLLLIKMFLLVIKSESGCFYSDIELSYSIWNTNEHYNRFHKVKCALIKTNYNIANKIPPQTVIRVKTHKINEICKSL